MILLQYDSDNLPYEKVGKNEPVCIADEVPFDIPDTWEWVRLSTICQLIDGIKMNNKNYHNLDARYMRGKSEPKTINSGKFVSAGSYLILVDGENSGEVFIAPEDGYMGSTFKLLWFSEQIIDKYFLHFIDLNKEILKNSKKGAAIPHLNKELFFNLFLPIPPCNEQKRIVEKLSTLAHYVNEYANHQNELNILNSNFPDTLKKSILQEAVQGKLVPQDTSDEPASVLLERIRSEKQRLIAEGKIKKDKHESVIFRRDNSHYEKLDGIERCIDDEIPFDIPETWAWSRLGSITELITSGSRDWAKYYAETGALFLRMGNLSKDSFDLRLNNIQRVQLPQKAEGIRTALQAGDLLFSITGEVGMLGLIPDEFETAYINQHTAVLRFFSALRNKYLPYFLLTGHAKKCYKGNQHGIKNSFRLDAICDILVPVPPSQEQKKIVDRIEELFNKITLV